MNAKFRYLGAAALACSLSVSSLTWAFAQVRTEGQKKTTVRSESETRTRTTEIRRSSLYLGASVRLHAGTSYGKVHEFVFNDNGCIEYIIVEHDDYYIPVPWVVTSFHFDDRILILDIDEARVREIPTFTEFKELSNTTFVQKVNTFYKSDSRSNDRRKSGETRSGDGRDSDRSKARDGGEDKGKSKDGGKVEKPKPDTDRKDGERKPQEKNKSDNKEDKDKDKDKDEKSKDDKKKDPNPSGI
jgi:hypothetical protein